MENQEPLEMNAPDNRKKVNRKKVGFITGIAAGALLAAYLVVCIVAAASHTVFSKTDVLGVDVSGLTQQEIQQLWSRKGAEACRENGISLMLDEVECRKLTLTELNTTISPEAAAQAAWQATHGGNFFSNGVRLIRSWFKECAVVPQLAVDDAKLAQSVKAVAEECSFQPIDGAYRVDSKKTDGFYVTKPANGRQVDDEALLKTIREHLEQRDLSAVEGQYQVLDAKPVDLDAVYKAIRKPKNAGYNKKTGGVTKERDGVEFDVAVAKQLLEQAEAGKEFVVPAKLTAAKVTAEELQEVLFRDVLGSYTTHVGGSWERLTNVRLAAESIDGCSYNSDEVFDYNTEVGERTAARGFQAAPAYVAGKTVDQIGGGICQVSSTLYYAAMLSNLEIVTRDEHQFAPSYITFGCDATVSWGGPDFSFRNDTDYPIQIRTYYYDDNLTVEIYGTKVDDTYVRITSETLSTTDYDTIYEKTDELYEGEQIMEQSPYVGYYVETRRNVYSGDGDLLSSTFEASSDYESRDAIIKVGTKKRSSASTTPTKPETKQENPVPDSPTGADEPVTPVTPDVPETET